MARGTRIVTRGTNYGRSRKIRSVGTSLGTRLRGTENPGGGIDTGVRIRKSRGLSTIRSKTGRGGE